MGTQGAPLKHRRLCSLALHCEPGAHPLRDAGRPVTMEGGLGPDRQGPSTVRDGARLTLFQTERF